jgi:hypothetical protein
MPMHDPAQTSRTLYVHDFWCPLEAECRTKARAEFNQRIDHRVTFVLINKFGDRCMIGHSLFIGRTDRLAVSTEIGETFPALAAAIRAHAAQLMESNARTVSDMWPTLFSVDSKKSEPETAHNQ